MIYIQGEKECGGLRFLHFILFMMMHSSELITYLYNFQFYISKLFSLETETTLRANEGVYCIVL